MRTRISVVALSAVLSLGLATGLAGCGDDDGGNNNNTTGYELSDEDLTAPAGAPDFSCEGSADPAMSYTVETEISGIVKDYKEKWAVGEVLVSVYESVQDLLDDNPYDTSTESAPNGSYSLMAPAGVPRMHFKIWDPTFTDYIVTLELNEPVAGMPPGPPQASGKDRWVVSEVTKATVTAVLGMPIIDGRGIVAGTIYDCNRDELENAAMRVYDGPESDPNRQQISLFEGNRNSFYFPPDIDLPSRDETVRFTDPEGRFLIANLIATPGEFVTVEMWGRHAGCPEGCLVSSQEVPALPDSLVITDMLPLYAE